MKKPDLKEELHNISKYLPYNLQFALISDKREDFEYELFYEDEKKWVVGAIWELIGINYASDLNITLGEGCLDGMLLRNGNTYCNFKYDVLPVLIPLTDLTKVWHKMTEEDQRVIMYCEKIVYKISELDQWSVVQDTVWQEPYFVFEILLKYHLDVYGLILKGLAIDKSTLKL